MKVNLRPAKLYTAALCALAGTLLFALGTLVPQPAYAQSETSDEIVDLKVTISEGETYRSISQRYFSTVGLWRHIAEYNQLDPTVPLTAGQVIRLPSIETRPREHADVVYSHGDATYTSSRTGKSEPISNSHKIYLQDIIATGITGFVSVEFRTGTVINLQPKTRVQLASLNCLETDEVCFIEVLTTSGSFNSTVNSQKQKTEFNILTPNASAAVRGTTFDFSSGTGSMTVGVTDGEVSLNSNDQDLALARGFGLKASANQEMGAPVALLTPPTFTSIPPRVAEGDLLGVWSNRLAVAYEWTLSTDEAGGQILNRKTGESTQFSIPAGLTAGAYYAFSRAVDGDGIKGFPRSEKISVAEIIDGPAITVSTGVENNVLLVTVANPDESAGYEIQLAESVEFIDAISVDVGSSGQARFASQSRPIYVRARKLIAPLQVSAFGPSVLVE